MTAMVINPKQAGERAPGLLRRRFDWTLDRAFRSVSKPDLADSAIGPSRFAAEPPTLSSLSSLLIPLSTEGDALRLSVKGS
ncbi:hypothetical protein CERSUDRAFT_116647 [Gelatoporia subvermispora B]|uniref:Uncharacterized protein n=1 Tax=Ceriporiopsis subvermispora (strain B) TaxID=914234 RepID=M2QDR1_CERS8|nr:hypothetical protein CERSUDRAFT_116647 [Gelatoporia subvermispora B]